MLSFTNKLAPQRMTQLHRVSAVTVSSRRTSVVQDIKRKSIIDSSFPAIQIFDNVTVIANRRRRNVAVNATADSPFSEENFHRVQFLDEPFGPMKIYQDPRVKAQFTGVMLFKLCQDLSALKALKVMEIFVAGDTAVNIYTLINNQRLDRPMVHDVMFSIMLQAQAGDPRRWGLLRVAIVSLQNDVFVGRLYFGDTLTQTVHWDCECRPSDGCYLSIKTNAPLFVHKSVWDSAAKLVEDSTVYQMLQEGQSQEQTREKGEQTPSQPVAHVPTQSATATVVEEPSTSHDYMTLMQDDLDAIKLLKRKLALAIQEEDYKAASAIRDHPYMKIYKEMFTSRMHGLKADAARYETELKSLLQANTLTQEPNC